MPAMQQQGAQNQNGVLPLDPVPNQNGQTAQPQNFGGNNGPVLNMGGLAPIGNVSGGTAQPQNFGNGGLGLSASGNGPINTYAGANGGTSSSQNKPPSQSNQLLDQLFQQMFGQIANGPQQFNFNGDVQPGQFNFDPNSFLNQSQAAYSNFNVGGALGATPQAQAGQSNFNALAAMGIDPNVMAKFSQYNTNLGANGALAPIHSLNTAADTIRQQLQSNNGVLPQLDPQTLAALQAQHLAATGAVNQQFGNDKTQLLNDLFGRGVNQSSIALDQSGRMLYGRDQLQNQQDANYQNSTIQAQQALQQSIFQNLMGQAGVVNNQAQTALGAGGLDNQRAIAGGQMGLQQALANAGFSNQAAMQNAQFQQQRGLTNAQLGMQQAMQNAGLMNQTNLANAGFRQQAGMENAQLGLQQSLANAGFQQSNNQLNSGQNIAAMQAALQAGLGNAGFQQQANLANASNQLQSQTTNYQGQLSQQQQQQQMLNQLLQQQLQRRQMLGQFGQDEANRQLQTYLAQLQAQTQLKVASMQKPGLFSQIFGGLAQGAGAVAGFL